jgi:hypothetical protein
MTWISVRNKLPEENMRVLTYRPKAAIPLEIDVIIFLGDKRFVWSRANYFDVEVTHWMPLPEVPEKENE